ncbi:voltage-dependent calcium channel gamma-6 subunit isoform X2 [Acanthopagrus latus]|uniref:voltage-dependent calcium channel gamma-6 subunit isoform X2 n=1 Tax=Acanthopagrus latus TaxID=8177 RepID=UPI00187BDCEE|nr:voltage-dependent calcium channel gamma-6 subunit isoform X2 [Acanthopagrus latus]
MWSNFFVQQDEDGRIGVAGAGQAGGLGGMKGGRGQRRTHKMSDSQEGKIKLAFFVSIIGVTLTVLGMGTEFWVELAQPKSFSGNQTCQMAHYGLWKGCIRTLWVADIDPERESCGPAELPGESNCTYFKFFTSGENAVIFKKTTNKSSRWFQCILKLSWPRPDAYIAASMKSTSEVDFHAENLLEGHTIFKGYEWELRSQGEAHMAVVTHTHSGMLFVTMLLAHLPVQECWFVGQVTDLVRQEISQR